MALGLRPDLLDRRSAGPGGAIRLGLALFAPLRPRSSMIFVRLLALPPLLLQLSLFRANEAPEDLACVRSSLVLRALRHLACCNDVSQLQLRQVVGWRHPGIVKEPRQVSSLMM